MFKKIAIIGVGLIGGSIGLAIRRQRLTKEVTGVCRHKESLRKAKRTRVIDWGSLSYKDAVREADLVILAAPIKQIIKIANKIIPYVKKGCIITDAGSTKEEIVHQIERIVPKGVYFVGAHPLAGSEKRGVGNASADLFKNEICFVTKTKKTSPEALRKLSQFWRILGSRVKVLTPQQHDKIVALVSHLPHLVAVELVNLTDKSLDFVGNGFRDTTRIASSESEIWTDIFLTNIKHTLGALDAYLKRLKSMRKLIVNKNQAKLNSEFKKAKALRDALQKEN